MVLIVNASYSSRTSMSLGARPAIAKASRPDWLAEVLVRSCIDEICRFHTAVALPST